MLSRFSLLCLFGLLAWGQACQADVQFANIFGDHMVLQRGEKLAIFGTADPNEPITVRLQAQVLEVKADQDGRWLLEFEPISLGEPFEVSARGPNNRVSIKDVVAGEVWICSGQSNMEWVVANAGNPQQEIAAANFPMIRHVKIQNTTSPMPQSEANNSGWKVCSPETAGEFTAVGYYFARHLHQELDVPIGLINTSWGGTIVETWISSESLLTHRDFHKTVKSIRANAKKLYADGQDYRRKIAKWNSAFSRAMSTAESSDDWKGKVDDGDWETQQLPGRWESEPLKNFDGVVWYRRDVEIPESWAGKELTLSLGKIDDRDRTFVNGKLVGETEVWNVARTYQVPADLVADRRVTISVKVTDTGGAGGFYGAPETLNLSLKDEKPISLSGPWKIRMAKSFEALNPRPIISGLNGPNHPTLLYNAMVNPIVPVTFRGVIWYQGESNAGRAFQYRELFPLLINDWRGKWKKEFPFYWVQLANFTAPSEEPGPSNWAELREAQSMANRLPKTGQAVIIDIGEARDIHPKNKQDVGKRLALHALAKDYGKKVVYSGPTVRRVTREGKRIRISFDHVENGLIVDGGRLTRFEIAGEDRKFVWANAKLDYNEVIVSSNDVPNPVAVRYAWADNPEGCNLYNADGLPASPFRTDNWPGATQPQPER